MGSGRLMCVSVLRLRQLSFPVFSISLPRSLQPLVVPVNEWPPAHHEKPAVSLEMEEERPCPPSRDLAPPRPAPPSPASLPCWVRRPSTPQTKAHKNSHARAIRGRHHNNFFFTFCLTPLPFCPALRLSAPPWVVLIGRHSPFRPHVAVREPRGATPSITLRHTPFISLHSVGFTSLVYLRFWAHYSNPNSRRRFHPYAAFVSFDALQTHE